VIPCLADCLPSFPDDAPAGVTLPLPALGDSEGDAVRADLPPVFDAHVHLFDDATFERIWRWFDLYGWPVRYRLPSAQVIAFQRARGVRRIAGLCYSHKPGLARGMNRMMAALQAENPDFLVGLGTVLPGEDDAGGIVREAFALGLHGIKLHCHVQVFAPDDPACAPIYEACAEADRPLVIHAGREPRSPAYKADVEALCRVDRTERVLRDWPKLRVVVPHLGVDEYDGYADLLARYDNLWLDTTMVLAGYFPQAPPPRMFAIRPDRLLYGTDFPNLPYAWDRELVRIANAGFGDDALEALLGGNAERLYAKA
jgi:predicted TIM-barrel fold metal-dependent hydrolase